jgi:large subunit ribosomal protein L23
MKFEHPYDVIKAPVLTEESTIQTESNNKYVFKVFPKANKEQIRKAIEQHYDVKVTAVNTMNYSGKKSGRPGRRVYGRKADWKKAVVTLREGDKIELI